MEFKLPLEYNFLGVIPYSRTDDGKLRFLLGQEHPEKGWHDQLKWGSFGGSPETTDKTVYHGASREAMEEAMGFLGSPEEILTKIITKKVAYADSNTIMFPLKITYNAGLPKLYSDVYNYVYTCMKIDPKGVPRVPTCQKGYFEKVKIEWFTVNQIIRRRHEMRPSFYNFFINVIMKDPGISIHYTKEPK